MTDFDPRLTPARADLAAAHLKGKVDAPRYAEGSERRVVAASAPLKRTPAPDAGTDTELLFGEHFIVYDEHEGWAWGQSAGDSYVGYVSANALGPAGAPPTHTVAALRTYLYPAADLKTPPLALLSMNAALTVTGKSTGNGGKFSACAFEGTTAFAFTDHLTPIGAYAEDYVCVAETFRGTPYLWGGRQSLGLDCSALVQMALTRAGIACPRDTDMQEAALGTALPEPADMRQLRRGDLIFWKGHVGIMVDARHMLHANATYMAVTVNPLADFAARVRADAGPVTSVKRL